MSRRRFFFLVSLLIGIFTFILGRLFYLQIIKGEKFKDLARRNYLRERFIYPPRGDILDRNGKKIAYDVPKYVLSVDHSRLDRETLREVSKNLKKIFNIDLQEILKTSKTSVEPVRVKEDLTQEEVEVFYMNSYKLPGVFIEVVPKRVYPYSNALSHLVGYVGYPSEKDFKRLGDRITSKSFVGKMGLERAFDGVLLGKIGREKVMVNALGKVVKILSKENPVKGNTVVTTVDVRIQRIVERVFKDSGQPAGAVIVMNAKTGEILALASFPDFDPNTVYREWERLSRDKLKPMFNRALMGRYPPASVFKVPVSFAILDTKTASPWERVLCTGSFFLGNRRFYCWNRAGHGSVNLIKALQDSCDVYYYSFGYDLGPSTIIRYARAFGYGERIPFELPVKRGFLPTPSWKRRRFGEPWYDGDTVNMSIGQGFILSTLMEQVLMMSGIVNNGVIYRPTVIREIRDPEGKVLWKNRKKVWKVVKGKQEDFAVIRRALREVVRKGTGTKAFSRIVDLAGKTGTAQVSGLRGRKKKKKLPWRLRDHAWFVGFAPYRDPKFIIGVVVEHGESGGKVAAPIARNIMEAIYIEGINREL